MGAMSGIFVPVGLPPKQFRFGLWSLFRLQLVFAPLFLIPVYVNVDQHQHPYVRGLALLLAPAAYVVALMMLFPENGQSRPRVFPSVWQGAVFGVLFGALSMVPAMFIQWLPRFPQWKMKAEMLANVFFYASVREQYAAHPGEFFLRVFGLVAGGPVMLSFVLLHYALIGAAVGGVIGLQFNRRRHMASPIRPGIPN